MAVSNVYTYKILSNIGSAAIEAISFLADEIHVHLDEGVLVSARAEDGMIYPIKVPGGYTGGIELCPLTPENFLKKWISTDAKGVYITSKHEICANGLEMVQIKEYYDYPKMINDLESKGKVRTKPSKNCMATDPRKFWFLEDGQEYEVDCLGTRTCQYISEKVKDEWIKLTFFESDSASRKLTFFESDTASRKLTFEESDSASRKMGFTTKR